MTGVVMHTCQMKSFLDERASTKQGASGAKFRYEADHQGHTTEWSLRVVKQNIANSP
jgi:hypothetical protein